MSPENALAPGRRYAAPEVNAKLTEVDDRQYEQYCASIGLSPDPRLCTLNECMAIAVGRETPNGAFLFAGTGLPIVGCMFAQHSYAPDAVIVMESGIVGPKIKHLPISVSDPRASYQCTTLSNMADAFGSIAMRGYCTVGILGGAECDRFGNLNSTVVGSTGDAPGVRDRTSIRLAGSGGANSIASVADSVIAMMVHEKRRFPERCYHLTSPAGARGKPGTTEHRYHYGLFRGKGVVVITTLGILRAEANTGELLLDAIYQGVREIDVYRNTGWTLKKSPGFHVLDPPRYEELKVLRYVVDPDRFYLGRPARTG